jgi:Raf kinase inhibitor-like YbhB/YbcL family protein
MTLATGGERRRQGVGGPDPNVDSSQPLPYGIDARDSAHELSPAAMARFMTPFLTGCPHARSSHRGGRWGCNIVLALIAWGCSSGDGEPTLEQEVSNMTAARIEVTSSAFTEGARIPTKFTCDGEDRSPSLKWSAVPQGTGSIALITDDPDAPGGTWVHWVLYGLPPDVAELPEGVPTTDVIPRGARQGINDFKRRGYGGPCPPPGHGTHRYFFKVYALDTEINLGAGATKEELLAKMQGHVLADGQLMGAYERK